VTSSSTALSTSTIERRVLVGELELSPGPMVEVRNPYRQSLMGRVGQTTADQVRDAVAVAFEARNNPIAADERVGTLDRMADELSRRRSEFATSHAIAMGVTASGTGEAAATLARPIRVVPVTERLDLGSVLVNEDLSIQTGNMSHSGVRDSGDTKEGPARIASELPNQRLSVCA
jgi:Aldehyde dehydrogenase family